MKAKIWITAALAAGGMALSCGSGVEEVTSDGDLDSVSSSESALCTVLQRELMINQLSVVEDPVRTTWSQDPAINPKAAAWTFGRLMQQMAGDHNASDFTLGLFNKWKTDQTANGFTVTARPAISTLVLNPWPKLPDGRLDLKKAPLRLLAIVNRVDLRKLSQGNAGEGRFVFGVTDSAGNQTSFTVILEYKLPAATQADVVSWAQDWHALGTLPFPSPTYNDALQKLTDRFAGAGIAPTKPNGSSIGQIRTNEIALEGPWQLREFHLGLAGNIVESTIANEPAQSFDRTATLAEFINTHEAALIAGKQTIPLTFNSAPFRGAATFNSIDFWSATGINNNDARHGLSVNTCNGCHGRETNTGFLQVGVRQKGVKASLSGFLTGEDVTDPVVPSKIRHFADISRRATDLASLACAAPATLSAEAFESDERVH
jgi:hypothetical protein